MNVGKKILVGLIVVNAYFFLMDLFRIIEVVRMTDYHTKTFNIFYTMIASFAILAFVKNTCWIAAGIFGLLHSIAQITSAFLFKIHQNIHNILLVSVMIIGMICLLVSSFYYYKLFKLKEFKFEDSIRLRDLDNYLKKKFRSSK